MGSLFRGVLSVKQSHHGRSKGHERAKSEMSRMNPRGSTFEMKATMLVVVIVAGLLAATQAQVNPPPVRLAVVSTENALAEVADLITVEISHLAGVALLERAEIDRVFRELALSASGNDYLKLGQQLNADGLLLLNSVTEKTNHFIGARLVAVRPGVVIDVVRLPSAASQL